MNLDLKLFRYLWVVIFSLISFSVGAKLFPKNFHSEYQLLQKSNNLGRVIVDFNQKNNKYEIKAITKAEGILKLLGDREVISKGQVSIDGFSPLIFKLKNKKKPKKNILAIFDSKDKQVKLTYKQETKNIALKEKHFDVLTYLYQFNFESLSKKNYIFEVVDGKKSRTYEYNRVRSEFIKTISGSLEADVYEGEIKGKSNSTHYLWILREPYRIPLKIEIKTDIGINIEQILVKTNLLPVK
tara:strand:+ start:188 stop:910 length:723 start_codon:yes stop_codon:yes gene_type:complete